MGPEPCSGEAREHIDLGDRLGEGVLFRVAGLQPCARAERGQEKREKSRDGEAKPRLELLDLANRWVRAGPRNSQNRTRARRYACGVRTRHAPSPLGP